MKQFADALLFRSGRKVAFGLHVFGVSTLLLAFDKIGPTDWLTCVFLSSALIGGGTIAETYLKGKSGVAQTPGA
jgi:hypothetical protein